MQDKPAVTLPLFEVTDPNAETIKQGERAHSNGHLDLLRAVPMIVLWVPGGEGQAVGQSLDGLRPVNDEARRMLAAIARAGEEAKKLL